jgi:hypothetical protein
VFGERLDGAQRLGQSEQFEVLQELATFGHSAFQEESDHTTEAFHLLLRKLVLRVRRETCQATTTHNTTNDQLT